MSARFEIVRTNADQPWHARFRAGNGRIVWTTEQYARRRAALVAVKVMAEAFSRYIAPTLVLNGDQKLVQIQLEPNLQTAATWTVPLVECDEREVSRG